MKKLLAILVLISVIIFTGCKKDDQVVTVGLCPLVVSTIPLDKAVNIPLNQIVSATFNEAMNPATITSSSFTITGTTTLSATVKAATVVTGTVTYSGMKATFTPSSPLATHTTYTGTIKTSAKDLAGNALQADYVWSFNTDVSPTVTPNPIINSVDVPLNKIIVATFSAPMDTLTLKAPATTITVKQGTTVVAGKYSFTSTTASFTPTVALSPFTVYTVGITTAAKNTLGTPLAADFIWNFTTIPQVTLSSLPVLGGTTTGGGTFAQGSAVTVTAVANAGYSFINWTDGVTVVSTNAIYPLTMAGNKTLVANFAVTTYTLGVTAVNGTVVKVPNTATYNSGAIVALTATPLAGYTFTSWSGDATGTANPLTVSMNGNKNITANFTAIVVNTFTLNVTAVNGTVLKNPVLVNYNSGSTVTLTPTASTGYVFTSWSGDATGTANPLTVTMNANKNITANFTAIPVGTFTLNVSAVNGTVIKNPDQLSYNSGSTVALTATPNSGYIFSSWSGDATGSVSPVTVIMNANKNVTANFILAPAIGPGIIDLGSAKDFTTLTKSGISTTGVTSITGNIGVSPSEATSITGFGLIMDASGQFSTSPGIVTGKIYAPSYAAPTPAKMTAAVSDMELAFTTANGLTTPAPIVNIYAGDISGRILPAGLYKWSTNVLITNAGVTLTGGPNDTWVFQIAQDLIVNNSAIITLLGGAQAKNVFWVVTKQANLGTNVDFSGNILSGTLISLNTGAKVTGKLLAQTAVTLNAATVVEP
jgi:uncharacterized repeat protein (TIGR02543 family)